MYDIGVRSLSEWGGWNGKRGAMWRTLSVPTAFCAFVSKFSMFFSNTMCFLRASSSWGFVSVFCKKDDEGARG
jgi:hypothetical protein